jgi:hypothetical protein
MDQIAGTFRDQLKQLVEMQLTADGISGFLEEVELVPAQSELVSRFSIHCRVPAGLANCSRGFAHCYPASAAAAESEYRQAGVGSGASRTTADGRAIGFHDMVAVTAMYFCYFSMNPPMILPISIPVNAGIVA